MRKFQDTEASTDHANTHAPYHTLPISPKQISFDLNPNQKKHSNARVRNYHGSQLNKINRISSEVTFIFIAMIKPKELTTAAKNELGSYNEFFC
jgi:hypothetical protein